MKKKSLFLVFILFCAIAIGAGTYTTNLNLYIPALGEKGWVTAINNNFDIIDTAVGTEHNTNGTHKADVIDDTNIDWGTGTAQVSADDIPDGSTNVIITATQETNFGTAYGWGNHASAGYLTAETDPKVGSLTQNYLAKWGATTLSNSQIYDNGTNVGIGTSSPVAKLDVNGSITAPNINSLVYVDGLRYAQTRAGVQAALDAVEALGGGVVEIPANVTIYITDTPIYVPSSTELRGQGWSTVIKLQDGSNPNWSSSYWGLISNKNIGSETPTDSQIIVRDLTVDGNKANNSTAKIMGVSLWRCTNALVENVQAKNCGKSTSTDMGCGIEITAGISNKITKCHTTGNDYDGIRLDYGDSSTDGSKYCLVTDNTAYENARNGIQFVSAINCLADGNTIYGSTLTNGFTVDYAWDSIVSNNTITGCHSLGLSILSTVQSLLVTGNVITANGARGIDVWNQNAGRVADSVSIVGNVISENVGDGIKSFTTAGTVTNLIIKNNTFQANGGYGVNLGATTTGVTLNGNKYLSNVSGTWVNGGATGVIVHEVEDGSLTVANGNVGIGTTSPSSKVHIVTGVQSEFHAFETGSVAPVWDLFRNDTSISSDNTIGILTFSGADNAGNVRTGHASIRGIASGTHSSGDNPTRLSFYTTPSGSATQAEVMRLAADGNVGIGTTSPSQKLDLVGNAEITGTATISGNVGIGTTSTAKPLTVIGEIQSDSLTVESNTIDFGDVTDEYVLAFDADTNTWRGVEASGGGGTQYGQIKVYLDGSLGTTGVPVRIPYDCTVTGWALVSTASNTVTVDVWMDTYANNPPTNADTITNGHEPAISAAAQAVDTDLADWSDVTLVKNDYLLFNTDANTNGTEAVLYLYTER